MPMAITEENVTDDIYQTAKLSIDHVKVKTAMPSDVDEDKISKCLAPALVMGAEKDCLFRAPESLRERRRSFRIAQHTFFVAGDTCIS